MSTQISKLRQLLKPLIAEQINSDREMVKELDSMDKAIKSLDSNYRAMINNSFSRVVLDDGQDGKLFDVQLNPIIDFGKDGKIRYDLRAYVHDSDRIYRNNVSCEDVCDFIKDELKSAVEEGLDSSYVRKALEKGKAPYKDDSNHEYKSVRLAESKKKEDDCDCESTVGDMEEVKEKDIKKQKDYEPKDLEVDKDEIIAGLGLEELVDKIENAVWGAIKREVESTHTKTAKAEHDKDDSDTKKNGHTVTKQKRHSKKTKKMSDKPKDLETDKSLSKSGKGGESKVGTPKVSDFKDDKRKAKSSGKDEEYKAANKKSKNS